MSCFCLILLLSSLLWISGSGSPASLFVIGPEDICPLECMEAMAQPQISTPDYFRSPDVAEERRNAPTPPPGGDESEEQVAFDLVSDDSMLGHELREAGWGGVSQTPPQPLYGNKLGCTNGIDSRLAMQSSTTQLNPNSTWPLRRSHWETSQVLNAFEIQSYIHFSVLTTS